MKNLFTFFSRDFSHAVNDVYWFILPSVLPLILAQFGLEYGTAGGILTVFLGTIAIFSWVFGKISDHIPRGKIISIGFLLSSLGLALIGLATSLTWLVFSVLFTAVGVSTYHPVIYALIDESVTQKKGKMYGRFEFWGTLGVFIMFFAYGTMLRIMDWRGLFFLTALPAFFLGLFLMKKWPERLSDKKEETAFDSGEGEKNAVSLLTKALFFAGVTIRILSITGVVNFIPTFLVYEVGFPAWMASYATAFIFLGGMVFTPLVGIWVDRWGPLPVLLLLALSCGPFMFLIGLLRLPWLLPILLVFFGGTWYGASPPQNIVLSSFSQNKGKGQSFGILLGLMTFSNAIGPGIFGLLADRVGLGVSVQLFALPALLGGIFFLFMGRSPFFRVSPSG